MSTGVGATVMLSGQRLPDGSPEDSALDPNVLSGLNVTWGRSTTQDQPAAATCTFDVLDAPGGMRFPDMFTTGRPISVYANGTSYPDPTVSTFLDPGFDRGDTGAVNAGDNARTTFIAQAAPTVRTNLVTNPSIETSTAGWVITSAGYGTLSVYPDPTAPAGTSVLRVTTAGTGVSRGVRGPLATAAPGTALAGRIKIRSFAGRVVNARIDSWTASAQVAVGAVVAVTSTGDWQSIELSEIVAAGATAGRVVVYFGASIAAGAFLDLDAHSIEAGPGGGYFDGDTPDSPTVDYAWTGTPHASTSTATTRATTSHLAVMPSDAARRSTVVLAPAPFSTNPAAWDAIATTSLGQTWKYGAWIMAAPGSRVEVRPVLFTAPVAGAFRRLDVPPLVVTATSWTTVAATFHPDAAGAWVGLEVTSFPTGLQWDQVDPALTWDTVTPTWTWDTLGTFRVDDVAVLAPAAGTDATVLVFSGRITDLEAGYEDGVVLKVTAVDFTADLENRTIGDAVWLQEGLKVRANRILTLSGLPITITVADPFANVQMTWRDVDRQGALTLLGELAKSVDGILWHAVHRTTGAYLELEDPNSRDPLRVLALIGGLITPTVAAAGTDALVLSACDVLRDPVRWVQSVSDVLTRASVGWNQQGVDEDGQPATTERTETVVNATSEAVLGTRAISISTQLAAQADAVNVANGVLARSVAATWRAQGFVIDDRIVQGTTPDDVESVLRLLDGTRRIGCPMLLTDMPGEWTPVRGDIAVYLEGGTYEFLDGAWVLSLTVSNAAGQGQSAAWNELPAAWTWNQWDPLVTWNDLRGAAAPKGA